MSVQNKLVALYDLLPDGDNFTIMIDAASLYELKEMERDYCRDYGKPMTWRDMPIEVCRPPISLWVCAEDAVETQPIACLVAIRYERRENGRIAYLDDPDNSEVFL